MNGVRTSHRTPRQIFLAPAIVGVLSAIGLLAALVGDGVWDTVSWTTLLLPIVLCAYFIARGRKRGGNTHTLSDTKGGR